MNRRAANSNDRVRRQTGQACRMSPSACFRRYLVIAGLFVEGPFTIRFADIRDRSAPLIRRHRPVRWVASAIVGAVHKQIVNRRCRVGYGRFGWRACENALT